MPQRPEDPKIHKESSTDLKFNFKHSQAGAWEREGSLNLCILRDFETSWSVFLLDK